MLPTCRRRPPSGAVRPRPPPPARSAPMSSCACLLSCAGQEHPELPAQIVAVAAELVLHRPLALARPRRVEVEGDPVPIPAFDDAPPDAGQVDAARAQVAVQAGAGVLLTRRC